MINIDTAYKVTYMLGLIENLKQAKGTININKINEALYEKIEKDRKYKKISSDFEFTQNEINELIDFLFKFGIIFKSSDKSHEGIGFNSMTPLWHEFVVSDIKKFQD